MAGTPRRSEQNGQRDAVRASATGNETTRSDPGRAVSNRPRPRPSARPFGEDALNRLFRDYHSQLLRFCRIRTHDAPEAEDLVQDAFVAVRRAYPDKDLDELRPLLFTTLRNLTLNYLKSGNTKRQKTSVDLLGRDDRLGCPRRFEQLTYEEIAERLSVSRSTVKKDLADAIAEVAEALARKSGPGADSGTVRK